MMAPWARSSLEPWPASSWAMPCSAAISASTRPFADSGNDVSTLARGYVLAVAIAAVGLSLVYALGPWDRLNRGLGFRPVSIVIGGLTIGIGMVVAASCTSGLFYKLGSGMAGACVGLAGWAAGELAAKDIRLPGPTLLAAGEEGTIPGRARRRAPRGRAAVAGRRRYSLLWRGRLAGADQPSREPRRWRWPAIGIGIGLATVAGWALAGAGGRLVRAEHHRSGLGTRRRCTRTSGSCRSSSRSCSGPRSPPVRVVDGGCEASRPGDSQDSSSEVCCSARVPSWRAAATWVTVCRAWPSSTSRRASRSPR